MSELPAKPLSCISHIMPIDTRTRPEQRAVILAFICNFTLFSSYYILRPVRDTVATIVGVDQLQTLFTATFFGTLLASAVYTALASRLRLSSLLPATFWFWLLNVLLFALLFHHAPESHRLGAAYYIWFSVTNLFLISVFWSLMVDLFSPAQATRHFSVIAGGGAVGAIAGPLLTRTLVSMLGLSGLLLLAAAGFAIVILLIHLLMREKKCICGSSQDAQQSSLDHALKGSAWAALAQLLKSGYLLNQAGFLLLMTWVNTVAYYCQTEMVARSFTAIAARTQVLADIDLIVNIGTAIVLFAGTGRIMQRFGVTAGLVLNPLLMVIAFLITALSPTLFLVQLLQIVRRIGQYAIARPSREICFTVVPQSARYASKNFIDTVIYRFGDLSSAWVQLGLRSLGYGMSGALAFGVGASVVWMAIAATLGQRYERNRLSSDADRRTGAVSAGRDLRA